MKLLFSEQKPDHSNYVYPYSIWAFPEANEKPSDFFNAGFLPSSRNLDRFYLGRSLRAELSRFQPSSENRRILRKGEGIHMKLVPRADWEYTPQRREFFKNYADAKFGKDVMSFDRLDSLFCNRIVSHLLIFTDVTTNTEIGSVVLFLEEKELAYYYYSFYDLNHPNRSLGLFMMTSAIQFFASQHFRFVYLGTCYSRTALYKTQFPGIQFFNGFLWSENLEELKYMIDRGQKENLKQHLLETEEFRQLFYGNNPNLLANRSTFRLFTTKGS